MKKILGFLMAFLLAGHLSYAAVDVKAAGTSLCTAEHVNFSTGSTATCSGNTATVTLSGSPTFTGDVTFRSTLLANGRAGGASTMSSSSTFLSTAGIAYSVIQKRVGGGGGLDSTGIGSTLPNGTIGQVITFQVTALQSGGSWVVTPTTSTGFTKLTFTAVGSTATLLYVNDTVGWVIMSFTTVTVTTNQIP